MTRRRSARAGPPSGSRATTSDGVVAGDGAQDVGQADLVQGGGEELRRARAACAGRRGWRCPRRWSSRSASSRVQPRRAAACARSRRRRSPRQHVAGRRAVGPRSLTAPSSSRSRESVAWVTSMPSSASSRASWVCEVTGCAPISSTMRACRAPAGQRPPVMTSAPAASTTAPSARAAGSRPRPRRRSAGRRSPRPRSPCRGRRAGSAARRRRRPPGRAPPRRPRRAGTARSARSDSSSWPIDTQVSVASTSAPAAASSGSAVQRTEPPVAAAIAAARARTAGSGWNSSGEPIRTCMPAVAPPSR